VKHRVLFLTDSLGLPRPDKSVLAHETWCQLVAKNLNETYEPYFQLYGGLHSKMLMLYRNQGYLAGYEAETVILQIGIVDCSARVLPEKVKKIISAIPIISRITRNIIKRYHRSLSTLLNVKYVKEKQFEKNLIELRNSFSSANFIVIPIAPATKGFIEMMPRISRNIEKYNLILEKVFQDEFISDAYQSINAEELLLPDHYHLNVKGHEHIYKKVTAQFPQ
tara:strand:- start:271 stop:936 length:666 start_codon:yes stop_codon:yes gene_type:complete